MASLDRAGADCGASIACPPWVDADTHPTRFKAHAEDIRLLMLDRARAIYAFLSDRLDDSGRDPLTV